MRAFLLLACLSLAAPASAGPVKERPACRASGAERVAAAAGKPGIRKLGQLPPASQYLTVYRSVDRCPQPVVLREGIGNTPALRPR